MCWTVCRGRNPSRGTGEATVDLRRNSPCGCNDERGASPDRSGAQYSLLKRQRQQQVGQLSKKQSSCTKHIRAIGRNSRSVPRTRLARGGLNDASATCATKQRGQSYTSAPKPGWGALLSLVIRRGYVDVRVAGTRTSVWRCGNTAKTSTISPTNASRPISRASLAPNEEHRVSVPDVGTNKSPGAEIGHAESAGFAVIAISWAR